MTESADTQLRQLAEMVETARKSRNPAKICDAEEALFRIAPELLAVALEARAWLAHLRDARQGRYADGVPGELMDAVDALDAKAPFYHLTSKPK